MKLKGKVWVFGNDIDTDVIISGKYLRGEDPKIWGEHVFEVLGDYGQKIQTGDIVVGGENFGCGSSREQAALAVKEAGISVVVAQSFGRIFFRNCINVGLPVVICPDLKLCTISDGDIMTVDLEKSEVIVKDNSIKTEQLPEFMVSILQSGGLINYYNTKVAVNG